MQTQNIEQQAQDVFPLADYLQESSVLHARDAWVKAKQYLEEHNLEPRPLIGVRRHLQ